jgi:cation diffusion facilitator CzcD-associated flavoprotein CzcO
VAERVAIVGSGLAGFVAYTTLRHAGLDPAEITVFGDTADPAGAWRPRAAAIRQRLMRSESDGHCYPTSFPGLAAREAVRRRDLLPLVRSACDRYRPTVTEFLRHVEQLRERSRWDDSIVPRRIKKIQAVDGGFELDGYGAFRHVLVASGHPGLAMPEELAGDRRAVHAYQPHEYAAQVTVVGAGMAAATEWLNALAAGAEVVSVRRREPVRRPLNVARHLFTKRGLVGFYAVSRERRAELLQGFGEPSYPPGRRWDAPLERAAREGRFRIEHAVNGAEQVICATGFRRGFRHDPLLAALVDDHELETEDRWIVLADDASVPGLTDRTRTLALAGAPGQWIFPASDTLVGMKVAARRFRRRVESCPTR